jgi:adenylosuccinate synthase
MTVIDVVVGGQYGSEAKGHVAAYLCRDPQVSTAVRVAGPNAGHSAQDEDGKVWALRQIPVAAVAHGRPDLQLVLGAGSEIDPRVLHDEIVGLEKGGHPVLNRLWIDGSATLIEPWHLEQEAAASGDLNRRTGSTAKGVGAARAERLWRRACTWSEWIASGEDQTDNRLAAVVDTGQVLRYRVLNPTAAPGHNEHILIEGTQGYALGLHGQHYPQCTSSDCTARDFLAMAGLNGWDAAAVVPWVVLRTYPIRVAGNSGRMNFETTWERLAQISSGYIKPERTTVTRKIRRVGMWDSQLAADAVEANGPASQVALMFFDYVFPDLAGVTDPGRLDDYHRAALAVYEKSAGAPIRLVGTGPGSIIDLR